MQAAETKLSRAQYELQHQETLAPVFFATPSSWGWKKLTN